MGHDSKQNHSGSLSIIERALNWFSSVRAGEGKSILLYGLYVFLILVAYYLLKNIREAFILTEFSSEVRSYAVGTIALTLLFIVPLYNLLFNYTNRIQLVRWITAFFVINILMFYFLYQAEVSIGFFFFVWVGIYGVLMISQFWAFAADSFNLKSGQRLFPIIMIGAGLGGLAGSHLTKVLAQLSSPGVILLTAAAVLFSTMFLTVKALRAIPPHASCQESHLQKSNLQNLLGGIAIVAQQPYLRTIAIFVVILNCINSTGEYILANRIEERTQVLLGSAMAAGQDEGTLITLIYSDFYFWVTLVSLLMQAFVVGRIYSKIGIAMSTLIMPVFVFLGYIVIGFIPIFSMIYIFKIIENSIDYSVMNTTRQAFFLPLTMEEKYHGKTAIDTFFWRFGDMVQALLVFGGIHYLGFGVNEFIMLSIALAAVWIWLSFKIIRLYKEQVLKNSPNNPPILNKAIADEIYQPGSIFLLRLEHDTFVDPDPGDTIDYEAMMSDGSPLPVWLEFDAQALVFSGKVPHDYKETLNIKVVAKDFDGLSADDVFKLSPA